MRATGWAVIHGETILTKTVSDTQRAAIVNWLVTDAGRMILASHSDEEINRMWATEQDRRGGSSQVDVRLVRIELL